MGIILFINWHVFFLLIGKTLLQAISFLFSQMLEY